MRKAKTKQQSQPKIIKAMTFKEFIEEAKKSMKIIKNFIKKTMECVLIVRRIQEMNDHLFVMNVRQKLIRF